MFTKEERLFIWKEAYREIEELRTGEYICVALKHAVFKFFVTPKNSGTFYGMPLRDDAACRCVCAGSGSIPGISQTINHNHMEVITFGPDMDLSSKKAGDVFRLKLYGIEYDVKVVGDDEDPLMFCKDCIFFNNSERCSLSESQDWCLKKQVVYCKIRHDGGI